MGAPPIDVLGALSDALVQLGSARDADDVESILRAAGPATAPDAAPVLLAAGHLACDRIRAQEATAAARVEMAALQTVALQVLTIRDLEQVLLSVANTVLRLVDADICGVLLLDGEMLVMRSCVGHRTIETASLRMKAGQGLAGRVLEHGRPWQVERYVEAVDISRDFRSLAVKEGVEAALGVPLRSDQRLIGVLEVWRRRRTAFTDSDVVLMTALAGLVSIAIGNADLHAQQARIVAELSAARRDLEEQVAHLRRSTSLQRRLLNTLVLGTDCLSLASSIGQELDCSVAILSSGGGTIATFPEALELPAMPIRRLLHAEQTQIVRLELADAYLPAFAQQARAGPSVLGVICLFGCSEAEAVVDLVLGQACSAYALHHLNERAASEARAKARDELVWDLVDGDREQRVMALDRAHEHGIDLRPATRVLYGVVDAGGPDGLASTDQAAAAECVRREVHRIVSRAPDQLGSSRGERIVVIARDGDRGRMVALMHELGSAVGRVLPAASVRWGVSAACNDAFALPTAFGQAQAALTVGGRVGRSSPVVFDELGVVRVLFSDVGGADLARFVRETLGALIEYDEQRDGALLKTLQIYFVADCSQKEAAEAFPVHHKTLRYRLDKIEELTGLDLTRHADRVRASIALELLHLAEAAP